MTIDHPVRRVLARICSNDTMARVVDPTLADVRVEDGRLTVRGCLALARALTVHAAISLPGAAARLWSDDAHALPRAAFAAAATALVLAAPLVAYPVLEAWRPPFSLWRSAMLMAPQALVLALPAALLVAIPLAFRRVTANQRIMRRGLVLSVLWTAATFVMLTRVMPAANQTWRDEVSAALGGRAHFERGPNELSVRELRERIDAFSRTQGGERMARVYEQTYHQRLALPLLALPLGVLGILIARSTWGRRRPVLMGAAGVAAYVVVLFLALNLAARLTALSPVAAAWTPTLAVALVCASLRWSAPYRRAISA